MRPWPEHPAFAVRERARVADSVDGWRVVALAATLAGEPSRVVDKRHETGRVDTAQARELAQPRPDDVLAQFAGRLRRQRLLDHEQLRRDGVQSPLLTREPGLLHVAP